MAVEFIDVDAEYLINDNGKSIGTIWCDHGTWRLNAFEMFDVKTLKPIISKMKELQAGMK